MQLTVVGNLKLAISTGTLGVDNTLWDTLAVEVGELVDQVEVLEKERAIWTTCSLVGLSMGNWGTVGCGIGGLLVVFEGGGGRLVRTHGCCYCAVKQLYGGQSDGFLYWYESPVDNGLFRYEIEINKTVREMTILGQTDIKEGEKRKETVTNASFYIYGHNGGTRAVRN